MLLRHVVLFLNFILVTAWKLTMGWDPNVSSGPKLGGVYWILRSQLGLPGTRRVACVVLYEVDVEKNLYYVVGMYPSKAQDGLIAMEFFKGDATLQRNTHRVGLKNYRIFIHEQTNDIKGDPYQIMQLYENDLLEMPQEDLYRLVVASGMMNGWDPQHQDGPLLRGVYWIHSKVLGIVGKAELYIPCIVLHQVVNEHQVGNEHQIVKKYLVVRMSMDKGTNGRPATDFFGETTKMGLPITDINDIKNYYIYLHETYEVEGRPDIMRRWRNKLLKMSRGGVINLEGEVLLEFGNKHMN